MKRLYIPIILVLALVFTVFSSEKAQAQDPQFSQFYANPLYLNPAFAGSDKCSRFSLNYRNQWPQRSGDFVTYSASYDRHIRVLSGGVGILATSDVAGNGTITTNTISGIYSYQQTLSRSITLKFGLQGTYNQKNLDWDKLSFGDQIHPQQGFIYATDELPRAGNGKFADFSAGILTFTDKYFIGAAAHHINQPTESLILGKSRLPIRFTVHGGMTTPLKTKRRERKASISPNILYQRQADFSQLNIGLYVKSGAAVFGLWHRVNDSFIGLIGIHTGIMRIGYSYDLTTSRLSIDTGGAHELSIAATLKCKNGNDRRIIPSCAF